MTDEVELEIVKVTAAVRQRLGDEVAESDVAAAVRDIFRSYEDARVRQFVPLFVHRGALERLGGARPN